VGGEIIDGTGARRRKADLRIVGDTIREIGPNLPPQPGEKIILAHGLVVAPGFIDAHSHADSGLDIMPTAETQIRQGITTAIIGQDGGSRFPLKSFFAGLKAKPVAINIASFVGHGTIRRQVTGPDAPRPVTPEELAQMARLVEREMRSGALGLSSGLEYIPGRYSNTDELIACAKAAQKYGGLYISHVRNEDNAALEAFDELKRIAKEAKIPAQISHIKLSAKSVWGKALQVLDWLDQANREGINLTADVYPYLYWQSTIAVLIPTDEYANRALWEKGLADVGGPERVRLSTYTPDPNWEGKTLAEIALATGKDPVSIALEIIQKTQGEGATGRESVVVSAMQEEDLQAFLAHPRIMFCSDGSLRGAHPRGAGSFPRILGRYVRELKILTLEEAVRKMTALPALRMRLKDRGVLAPGKKADITLFDPETVQDIATIERPQAAPVGIQTVLVNGVPTLLDGKMTAARAGRPLLPKIPQIDAPKTKKEMRRMRR
jgi:N-acyl-D-amino-acid deacylase